MQAGLDVAQEGQELMQLVINHLNTAQAANSTASCSSGSSSPQAYPTCPASHTSPLMLRPVAMRGCLHLLLPVCTTPGRGAAAAAAGQQAAGCVLDSPLAALLQQISKPRVVQKALFAGASQEATSAQGRTIQLHIQVDSSEPQLVVKRPDGMWRVGGDSSNSTAAKATSSGSPRHTMAEPTGNGPCQDSSTKCWLEPACLMVGPQPSSSRSSPAGSPGPTPGPLPPPAVSVKGLPAEAGSLVRVLVVQGEAVVADQLLPANQADKQSPEGVGCGGLRSVR